jgi:cytochrome c oxidase accessory protein FixG
MAVHLPLAEAELASAALPSDGRRRAIQPADVRGRFASARRMMFAALILLWAALPWLTIKGHPALFIDVSQRKLFVFGAVFNAQDTWLLFFLLSGVGFSLVYATALAGRVWCGWACPQTVFLDGVYRRIERWVEGPRARRMRRNAGPWTFEKVARKTVKHALFLASSFFVAHILLSYFVSIPATLHMMARKPGDHPEAFAWAFAMTAVFYANFAWFREQLCVVLCPYGRLQSAMLDEHSLVVGYDVVRGEPRGKKGTEGAGDCVDCKRCVHVCPTGIDIRNGMQMECVACTACIDACDEVMDKLGRPRGLVRYDSPDGLARKPRRLVRSRMISYTVLLVVGAVVALSAARRRRDFEATLLRLPGAPYVVDSGVVRNSFQVHVVNKNDAPRSYRIEIQATADASSVVPVSNVSVASLADARVPVFVTVPVDRFRGDFPVHMNVTPADDARETISVSVTFLGPSR